jgi:hypothetical protein
VRLFFCLLMLTFLVCVELQWDDSSASELVVLDFEYFKYEKGIYILALIGTNEDPVCETAQVIKCVYKKGTWVPGNETYDVPCWKARSSLSHIREHKIEPPKKKRRGTV